MIDESNIFYSEYATGWCIGTNLTEVDAIRVQSALNINGRLGHSPYEVLSNNQTRRYENEYNLIVRHFDKEELKKIIPMVNNVLSKFIE